MSCLNIGQAGRHLEDNALYTLPKFQSFVILVYLGVFLGLSLQATKSGFSETLADCTELERRKELGGGGAR